MAKTKAKPRKPAKRAAPKRTAKAVTEKPRKQLAEFMGDFLSRARAIRGSYDAARNSEDFEKYWANADAFDADSANSREVRLALMRRSRYEVANNGYADGIAQTTATDLVGVGPTLRMQTGSKPFNQLVELAWFNWTKAIQFRRKLWTMAHAKHVDGETFAAMRMNRRVKHPVQLDLILYEAEQIHTPYLAYGTPNYIDGIKFDDFGNPQWYDLLRAHPGSTNQQNFTLDTVRVPAEVMLHWFKLRRPGQHRGVPECSSTLQLGAAFRRLREANLATSEKVAAWTLFLKTIFEPEELDATDPMSTMDVVHGMMTALPNSMEPVQLRAEHPGPTYDTFHKSLLNEQARPKSMPYNKAACDSSSYNYASGRLDHQTYYGHLDVDREDCNDLILDRTFEMWFRLAIRAYGWLGGNADRVTDAARAHTWDWPKHRVADVEAEANANRTKLESGQISITRLKSEMGMDAEDEAEAEAAYYGVSPQELKKRQLDAIYPPPKAAPATRARVRDEVQSAMRKLEQRGLNGVHHAN